MTFFFKKKKGFFNNFNWLRTLAETGELFIQYPQTPSMGWAKKICLIL